LAERIQGAEGELSRATSAVHAQFGALYRSFLGWNFERVKTRMAEEMIPGVGQLVLEQAVLCSKVMAGIRSLELTMSDAEGIGRQAGVLLERVSAAEGFAIPPLVTATPAAPAAEHEESIGLPWTDGRNQQEIDAAFLAVRQRDPSLDQAGAYRQLAREHPEWFKTQAEVLKMMEPIEQPKTGVWKAPMVGSTFVPKEPAEAQFSHAR